MTYTPGDTLCSKVHQRGSAAPGQRPTPKRNRISGGASLPARGLGQVKRSAQTVPARSSVKNAAGPRASAKAMVGGKRALVFLILGVAASASPRRLAWFRVPALEHTARASHADRGIHLQPVRFMLPGGA